MTLNYHTLSTSMALLWYSTSIFGSWNSVWKTETADRSNGGRPACGVALRNSRHSRWCRGFPPGEDHFDLLKLLKGEPILSSSIYIYVYIYVYIYIYLLLVLLLYIYIYKESSWSGSNIGFSWIFKNILISVRILYVSILYTPWGQ